MSSGKVFRQAATVMLLWMAAATAALAQTAAAQTTTRLLVTTTRVKPECVNDWVTLQRDRVIPALKKAGVEEHTVYQTLIGEASEFVSVRPLPSFGEFDGPDPLETALGAAPARELRDALDDCTYSSHQQIANRQDEFFIDRGTRRPCSKAAIAQRPAVAGTT